MSNDVKDYVGHGFYKIDEKHVRANPPKIKWTEKFLARPLEDQFKYVEMLARSMNQAALLIQEERDELGKLCEFKEAQLEKMKVAMDNNLLMLQTEMARLNEDRQEMLKAITQKNDRIRELEKQALVPPEPKVDVV